jgi:hypothetical protein
VGDLWLRTRGGPTEPGHGGSLAGSSHDSELDLALLVSDFLEGGSGDSRGSSDSESGLSDLAHLADKISVRPLMLPPPYPSCCFPTLLCPAQLLSNCLVSEHMASNCAN